MPSRVATFCQLSTFYVEVGSVKRGQSSRQKGELCRNNIRIGGHKRAAAEKEKYLQLKLHF